MKQSFRIPLSLILLVWGLRLSAQFLPVHTHATSDVIVSFDRDSGGAYYYQTSKSDFTFGGLYRWDGVQQTTLVAGNTDFSGASVVRAGDYVYYNTNDFSNEKIFRHGPLTGAAANTPTSNHVNWGLFGGNSGELMLTGANSWMDPTEVFVATLDVNGGFQSVVSLGQISGSPGPVAFDATGNLFYSPGFGDNRIYRYTADDVANALADPVNSPLPAAADRIWRDYAPDFAVSGASGMLVDDAGDLWVTLTDFVNPSRLVRMNMDGSGNYQSHDTLLSSTGRLGTLRVYDGDVLVSLGNQILMVPEPGTLMLLLGGIASLCVWIRRKRV